VCSAPQAAPTTAVGPDFRLQIAGRSAVMYGAARAERIGRAEAGSNVRGRAGAKILTGSVRGSPVRRATTGGHEPFICSAARSAERRLAQRGRGAGFDRTRLGPDGPVRAKAQGSSQRSPC
jgi:hypothetical protein